MLDTVEAGHIPVIDLSRSFVDDEGHSNAAEQVSLACESLGFLIVTGHGIRQSLINNMIDTSVAFFEQPVAARITAMPPNPYIFRGYFPSEASALAATLDIETPSDHHTTNLVANYYPRQIDEPKPGQLRRGAHTDYGSLTVLYQTHASGGLQVQLKNGDWLDVPYIEDSFVINLGDLLAVWTNDKWVSTMHRVVNPPRAKAEESRQSLAFFHQPNFDAKIECIPTCSSTDPPPPPQYSPTSAGEWVQRKLQKSVD